MLWAPLALQSLLLALLIASAATGSAWFIRSKIFLTVVLHPQRDTPTIRRWGSRSDARVLVDGVCEDPVKRRSNRERVSVP